MARKGLVIQKVAGIQAMLRRLLGLGGNARAATKSARASKEGAEDVISQLNQGTGKDPRFGRAWEVNPKAFAAKSYRDSAIHLERQIAEKVRELQKTVDPKKRGRVIKSIKALHKKQTAAKVKSKKWQKT
jgi:hypothetical protein